MKLKDIENLITIVEKANIEEFDYSSADGERVFISKTKPATMAMPMQAAAPAPIAPSITPQQTAPEEPKQISVDAIKSPIVGTFYRASSPADDNFVEVGQNISKGQVLCIIEAMKIMNQIKSEKNGVVKEILVENGQPVEYGQPMFIVE